MGQVLITHETDRSIGANRSNLIDEHFVPTDYPDYTLKSVHQPVLPTDASIPNQMHPMSPTK